MRNDDFIRRMYAKYGSLGEAARATACSTDSGPLFDRFLEDASIPLAIFHSRALGRSFVLARDPSALMALTEVDRRLPVLTFAECQHLKDLSVVDLGAILDAKHTVGPELVLREVWPARTLQ